MKKRGVIMLCGLLAMSICGLTYAQDREDTEGLDGEGYYEVASVQDLVSIQDDLSGYYVLTADIDLAGVTWTPLGTFVPAGEGEEEEIPDKAYAFTGTLDGDGHTISNLSLQAPEEMCVGLFGCAYGADFMNLQLENFEVEGMIMVGGLVGYQNDCCIEDVTANGMTIKGTDPEYGEGMFGGIVGAGMEGSLESCSVQADVYVPDNSANAGIVGGGLEGTYLKGCVGTGSVTAGENCYGLGGVSGCGFGSEEFTDCVAEGVTITTGANAYWVGGVTGYAGGYEDASFGVPVTIFSGCSADVTFALGEGSEEPGEIVGSGFYVPEYGESMGAPYDAPTVFVIEE